MRIDFKNCTAEELWKFIGVHLAKEGIDVILVGGAVVSIYTEGAYQSGDLDFVIYEFSRDKLNKVLNSLGFKKEGRHYKHPDCSHLFLEFLSFPVSIGEDTNIIPHEEKIEGQIIKIFTPTDSVRDRLASYIHFNAQECLDQAVMIAKRHDVDLPKVKSWCKKENASFAFDDLINNLKK
jgi:hypothetical protein